MAKRRDRSSRTAIPEQLPSLGTRWGLVAKPLALDGLKKDAALHVMRCVERNRCAVVRPTWAYSPGRTPSCVWRYRPHLSHPR